MKNLSHTLSILLCLLSPCILAQNAPISTVGTIATISLADTVPITATNFIYIGSCNLELLYDPAVVSVSSVITGPLLGGILSTDLSVPGTITLGWFTYPPVTLTDNSV